MRLANSFQIETCKTKFGYMKKKKAHKYIEPVTLNHKKIKLTIEIKNAKLKS